MEHAHRARPTWASGNTRLARYVAQPVSRFLAVEAAGGVVLLLATAAALIWANSPLSGSYERVWHTTAGFDLGTFRIEESLAHWVNDGLMALFFFVVGLEIKSEVVGGQLSSRQQALLPAICALGGMVMPAAIFLAMNAGEPGGRGWGIPMATDIAFSVGLLSVLGRRAPLALKVLLLALAVADDIGAIVVIAVVYTESLSVGWLAGAAGGVAVILAMRRGRVWFTPVYAVVGAAVWLCTLQSGIHATIAGVVLGVITPAKPLLAPADADRVADRLSTDDDVTASEVHEIAFQLRESVSVAERLQHALHPWTSYVVVPIFALANAGIPISARALGDAAGSPVTVGVVLGLVVGKVLGITAFAWIAVRLRLSSLPEGISWRHMVGMASIGGVGFTVSLFISGLAFSDQALDDQARIGILAASLLAAVMGTAILWGAPREDDAVASPP